MNLFNFIHFFPILVNLLPDLLASPLYLFSKHPNGNKPQSYWGFLGYPWYSSGVCSPNTQKLSFYTVPGLSCKLTNSCILYFFIIILCCIFICEYWMNMKWWNMKFNQIGHTVRFLRDCRWKIICILLLLPIIDKKYLREISKMCLGVILPKFLSKSIMNKPSYYRPHKVWSET